MVLLVFHSKKEATAAIIGTFYVGKKLSPNSATMALSCYLVSKMIILLWTSKLRRQVNAQQQQIEDMQRQSREKDTLIERLTRSCESKDRVTLTTAQTFHVVGERIKAANPTGAEMEELRLRIQELERVIADLRNENRLLSLQIERAPVLAGGAVPV
ncbi:MAG: hypothetical protein JXA94_03975 [Parachlamydiales bacterium]|nr:hypothetical protein [Parachlamydiales bacterium]